MRKPIAAAFFLAVVLVAGFWAHAQQIIIPQVPPPPPGPRVLNVVTGGDIGFWVDHWEGDTPVGRWVIRKEGRWVEPKTMSGTRRLTH
jgi:hypothetical protein